MASQFSAFAASGIRFTSRKPLAESIYEDLVACYGTLFGADWDSHFSHRMFARAWVIALAREQLQRAGNEAIPKHCTELLPKLEADYGIVVPYGATIHDRRVVLAAAMAAKRGSTTNAVETSLTELLGDGFIAIKAHDDTVWVYPDSSYPETNGPANFAPIDAPFKTIRLLSTTLESPVLYEYAAGSSEPLLAGEKLVLDPGKLGLMERVTVVSSTMFDFTATFTKPHDVGAIATTATVPYWPTSRRWLYVVVSQAVLDDGILRNLVHVLLQKILNKTVCWSLCTPSGVGTIGPFNLDSSILDEEPMTEINY